MNHILLFLFTASITFGICRLEKAFEHSAPLPAPVEEEPKTPDFDVHCVECPV